MWIRSLFVVCVIGAMLPLRATAAPSQPAIVVVVYPLVASQGSSSTIGLAVARVLIGGLSQHGDVAAKLAPSDTQQADYLQTARSLGATYYVAGFASTIGSEVSAIEQLVATKSGVVVWQNTAAYTVPDDARASGTAMRDAIVALNTPQYLPAGSASGPSFGTAPAPAAAPAAPSAPAAPTVSRRSSPSAPSTPLPIPADAYATPADPALDGPRLAVVNFDGQGLDAVKHYVSVSIIRTLPRYHMSGSRLDIQTSDVAADGFLACAQTGADLIVGGTVVTGQQGDPGLGPSIATDLRLNVYDCKHLDAKPTVIAKETANGDTQTSVDIAVDQALKQLAGMKLPAR